MFVTIPTVGVKIFSTSEIGRADRLASKLALAGHEP